MEDRTKKKNTEELKKEIETLTDSWKRALADYQNLQRRCEQEKVEYTQYASRVLVVKLLLVLDYLEKAQDHLKDEGLNLAVGELKKILTEEGLAEIEVQEKEFNPQEMEAVEVTEGGEEGKVAESVAKGYALKGKIIRPAKVKVFK